MRLLTLLAIPALSLSLAGPAFAQVDQLIPPIGGGGGSQYSGRCPNGQILNGLELRTGDDVDAIRPICATAYSLSSIGPRSAYPSFFGGTGGGSRTLVCPDNAPLLAWMLVGYEGEKTQIVNTMWLYCSEAVPNRPPPPFPQARFDGPEIGSVRLIKQMQNCPSGLVAVGINGRSGIWLDSVGFICGALQLHPQMAPPPAKSLGRVKTSSPPRPPMSICDAARDARRRNSPAAPNLEAQCEASKRAAAASPPPPTPAAPVTTAELDSLRARGQVLANGDALAKELRNRTTAVDVRRGFDIGMGVWAGNTAPGPGKQRIHDALSPLEQPGFDIAAAFSLPRNKNAVFANVGAAIASADSVVAKARAAENDVFYWLGFDIASGIFGNPAAGAQGNTAVGAGSLGIRDELNAPSQRGFNASTALHLGRKYR
jgi:hypothetical protein